MTIYVDADACPVREQIITIALRHHRRVMMVCNGGIRPHPHPLIELRIVPAGPDEADKWIADAITAGDILITSDIPLAAKAVEKQAMVLRADGFLITPENIGNVLAGRDLMAEIRSADMFHQSKSKPMTGQDKGKFSQRLDQLLTQHRQS
ncbi:MAG: YaiI/YqxD family protein [Alphaproteobacteria bacterium]|nr:YaiI/YqxD family protein [Alphaproteobacteria bacterium]